MKLGQLSIRNKFIVVSVFLLIVLAVFSVFIIYMTSQLAEITSRIYNHPLEVSNAAYYANIEVLRMHRDMKDIVLTEEDFEVNILVDKVRVSESNVYIALDTINYHILGEEGKTLENEARVLFEDWKTIRSEVIELVKEGNYKKAIDITKNKGADHVQRLERKLIELNQYARRKAEAFQAESEVLQKQTEFSAVSGTIAVFIVILAMILWLSVNVLGGIKMLGNSMDEIMSSGAFKDIELRGNDELVALSQIFNNLIQSLGRQLWVKERTSHIVSTLSQTGDVTYRIKHFLDGLVETNGYLSIAYYELDESVLKLKGTTNRLGFMNSQYYLGEHIVGECAEEKIEKLIVYEEQEHIAMSEAYPFKSIQVIPVIYDGLVYGVLEVVILRESSDEEKMVLKEAVINLGIHMASVNQRSRIDKLLEESIQSNDELCSRQVELEERTDELEEANRALQVQKDLLNMKSVELEDQNKELEKLRQELIAKYEDLEELSKYRSQFLANVSHELKTPLNSIILLSTVLGSDDKHQLSKEAKEKIEVINKAGSELLTIINDILDLSKIESGKVKVEPEIFETEVLIEELKTLYQPTIKDKGLKSRFEDAFKRRLYADKGKIIHIVTNFLSNAVKFTEEGNISIRIASNNDESYPIKIEVKDTGIGIRKDKLQIIFDEFVQSDGSISRTYGGTGLGLSICRNYASLIRGKIVVESKEGAGSSFTLLLPVSNLYEEHIRQRSALMSNSMRKTVMVVKARLSDSKKNKKVLICDDEPMNVFALSAMFEEIGVIPVTALSGEEALKMFSSEDNIDVIFVDYMMPGMDGIETIKKLKKMDNYSGQPIAMVTAATLNREEKAYVDAETMAFIQKPIIYNNVVEVLEKLL